MRKTRSLADLLRPMPITALVLAASACLAAPAAAEDPFLGLLLPNSFNLPEALARDPRYDATADLFGKPAALVEPADVAALLSHGAQLYGTKDMAFIYFEDREPVLLQARPAGGVDAYFFCRYIPICSVQP